MKLKAISGIILTLLVVSMVMANIAGVLAVEGDLNGDNKVNIEDLRICARAYGSMKVDDPTTPWDDTACWNATADIAPPYDIINIFDLRTIAKNYNP